MNLQNKIKIIGLKLVYELLNHLTNNIRNLKLIKLKLVIGLALLSSKAVIAQNVDFPNRVNKSDTLNLDVELEYSSEVLCYEVVITDEKGSAPEFKGGDKALNKFIKENVRYPKEAIANKIEGDVSVNFTIDADGKILDSQILKKLRYGLDEEALRLAGIMPKFKPGKLNGKKKEMNKTVIFHFELPK